MSEARLWYWRNGDQQRLPEVGENLVVLSPEFYREIIGHPIPTDLQAARALSGSPAALDLYNWLTYRCHVAKREERVPLFGAFGLTAQLGIAEYARPRKFRERLEHWLRLVTLMWPKGKHVATARLLQWPWRPSTSMDSRNVLWDWRWASRAISSPQSVLVRSTGFANASLEFPHDRTHSLAGSHASAEAAHRPRKTTCVRRWSRSQPNRTGERKPVFGADARPTCAGLAKSRSTIEVKVPPLRVRGASRSSSR